MNITNKEYKRMVKKASKKSPKLKDCIWAFLVGGIICTLGQVLLEIFKSLDLNEKVVKALVPVTLIFIAILLTGLKIFPKIAKHAGAGTLVPITGFANAVVSEAMDAKNEGYVLGVGAKIFTVAGPVILYGILSGVVYGVIYYLYIYNNSKNYSKNCKI